VIASKDLRASWFEKAVGAYALRTELLMRLDRQRIRTKSRLTD
jgi:hypothetical protein